MRLRILSMADTAACPDLFEPLAELAEVVTLPADQERLAAEIPAFDGYFCSLSVRMDRATLEQARRLKFICTPSTGLDHIDLDYARSRGIEVIHMKEETEFLDSVTATAEMAWALLLATMRMLPAAVEAAKKGIWARDRFRGHQVSGMTLGVLGYGRLGRIVAEYGKAFRMRVLACDVRDVDAAPGVEMVAFDQLIREADALSIHIHLTEENRGLLSRDALARMKKGAVIVNTSRGAIIDEEAMLDALESGHLGGAGLDVIHGEWDEDLAQHPLVRYANSHRNLVISPHLGGVTYESQRMAYAFVVQKLKRYLENLPR